MWLVSARASRFAYFLPPLRLPACQTACRGTPCLRQHAAAPQHAPSCTVCRRASGWQKLRRTARSPHHTSPEISHVLKKQSGLAVSRFCRYAPDAPRLTGIARRAVAPTQFSDGSKRLVCHGCRDTHAPRHGVHGARSRRARRGAVPWCGARRVGRRPLARHAAPPLHRARGGMGAVWRRCGRRAAPHGRRTKSSAGAAHGRAGREGTRVRGVRAVRGGAAVLQRRRGRARRVCRDDGGRAAAARRVRGMRARDTRHPAHHFAARHASRQAQLDAAVRTRADEIRGAAEHCRDCQAQLERFVDEVRRAVDLQ